MMKVAFVLFILACIGCAHAAPPSKFGRVGRDLGAVHAPAPSPALTKGGGTAIGTHERRAKKSKKEDKKSKDKGDKKDDKKDKKSKKDAEGRVHIRDSCESEQDAQVEVLEVKYDYTLKKEQGDDLDSLIRDTEEMIHNSIVDNGMQCEGPIQNLRRRLSGEHLRIVGVDPAPKDRQSTNKDFCHPNDDECVSINGGLTLILEGEVADEEVAQEKEEIAKDTSDFIKSLMQRSQRASLVDTSALGSSRYDNPSAEVSKQSVESSTSIGAVLAGVLGVALAIAGAAFVYKKTKNGEPIFSGMGFIPGDMEGANEGGGGSSNVPIASAKLFKSGEDSASMPTATVVEVDVNQSAPPSSSSSSAGGDPGIDKSRLRTNFGVSAVPM